jgi:hypothetical protein
MLFHADCWVTLHATVQSSYLERAQTEGIPALVSPYSRTEMASWLPEAAIDEAVESLSEQLEIASFDDPVLSEELRSED